MNTLVPRWTSADDVTPADLTEALREGGVLDAASSVASLTSEPIGVGVGIVSLLRRLDVQYDPAHAGPRTIILKLPHSSPEVRAAPVALGLYEREVGFYREVAATTPIGTPRCYWSSFDPETHDFALLLEDIAALDGHDQLTGCSLTDARTALLGIAGHHAVCWEREDILDATWTRLFNAPPLPQAMHQLLAMRIPIFAERLGSQVPDGTVPIVERIRDGLDQFIEAFCRGPLTLLHGDFRADNLFFTPDPGREVVAIDWQVAGPARAAYDVGYFLSQSVTSGIRKANEVSLLRDYHDALVAGGVRSYSFEECWEDYRRTILWSLVYPVAVVTEDLTDPRAIELAKTMATRSALAIADLDATELLES